MLKVTIETPFGNAGTHTFETVEKAIEFLNEQLGVEQLRSAQHRNGADSTVDDSDSVLIDPTSENSEDSWWTWICACEVLHHKADETCPRCGRLRPTK